ncbi:hypothetical protein GCM10027176_46470 [Actinoallomurus bryophytorum]|uniref:Ricin-type beta-trefoil lectin protein n=2 Tax=Actinoallomurus bryophytorum TaxID=1490222 RepID=A0A543CUW7_9ACTN|nr:ricin-type beta-trefoil lectin protein [Actinoallomurus bryophytorum]
MNEPASDRPERPDGSARPKLARALTASVRRAGDKGTMAGRIVTAGFIVVVTCALALGVGALLAHKSAPKAANVAAKRSQGTPAPRSPSPVVSPSLRAVSPSKAPKKSVKTGGGSGGGQSKRNAPKKSTGRHPAAANRAVLAVPETRIISYASGKCIDVTNEGQTGIPVQIWDCDPLVRWKQWAFYPDHTVRSMGKCMTAAGKGNGAPVELKSCKGGASQHFVLKASHDLVNTAADKCVDVKEQQTGNGSPLQIWGCGGTSNQKWHTG